MILFRDAHELTGSCSVNVVTAPSDVVPTALALAKSICANSPDAVQATKRSLILASEHAGVEHAFREATFSAEMRRVYDGANMKVSNICFTVYTAAANKDGPIGGPGGVQRGMQSFCRAPCGHPGETES